VTNTNWQSYTGEATMSYLSQMLAAWWLHNFLSAAAGIAIAASGLCVASRVHTSKTLGNFWVDMTRISYYLLLPISVIFAVTLISQGMIQNFSNPMTRPHSTEPYHGAGPEEWTDDKGTPVLDAKGAQVMMDHEGG